MKIECLDYGTESCLVITSWFFDWRAHNRLVDEMLFRTPQLRAEDETFFFRRSTIIYGNPKKPHYAHLVSGRRRAGRVRTVHRYHQRRLSARDRQGPDSDAYPQMEGQIPPPER